MIMKKIQFFFVASLILVATSCSSTYHAGSSTPDDVYYSTKDANQNQPAQAKTQPPVQQTPEAPAPSTYSTDNSNYQQDNQGNQQQNTSNDNNQTSSQQTPDYSNSSQSRDANGNTYVTNNYYNDDYYDYAYSAKLKRFYTPAYGYGYYDPFYTNLYWYDYNPVSWGVSIYLGYNWWPPSYYYNEPFCYGGFHHSYDPWYSPYYGGVYWNGYNNGYYQGGYGNSNPYYYNSYDATSHYYGPRGSINNNGGRTSSGSKSAIVSGGGRGGRMSGERTLGEKYSEALLDGRIKNTTRATDNRGKVSDGRENNGRVPATRTEKESINGVNPSSNPVPGTRTNPVTPRSEGSRPVDGNTPVRGIITEKNETGRPDKNQDNSTKTNNSVPVYSNPVKNSDGRPSQNQPVENSRPDKNVNGRPAQNSQPQTEPVRSRKNEIIARPHNEQPMQNENNNPRNENTPTEVPRNTEQPRQNQQPPQQNNEPRRPRQMSNSGAGQDHSPQVNHTYRNNVQAQPHVNNSESRQYNRPQENRSARNSEQRQSPRMNNSESHQYNSPQMNRSSENSSSSSHSFGNSSSGSGRNSSGNSGGRGRR